MPLPTPDLTDGTMFLPEPLLTYCQLGSVALAGGKFHGKDINHKTVSEIKRFKIVATYLGSQWVNTFRFFVPCLQGSHAFRMMKFLDFSRTFPGPNLIFQGPSRTKTTINTHKYSLPSNRLSLLLHKQGKQWFNGLGLGLGFIHAITCHNWVRTGPMLAESTKFQPIYGTLWHVYWGFK